MVFSLNYQHLFDFNRDWSFDMAWQRGIRERYMQQHYRQDGQLYAIGLAWGVQLTRSGGSGLEHLGFAQDVDEHTVYVSMLVRR